LGRRCSTLRREKGVKSYKDIKYAEKEGGKSSKIYRSGGGRITASRQNERWRNSIIQSDKLGVRYFAVWREKSNKKGGRGGNQKGVREAVLKKRPT